MVWTRLSSKSSNSDIMLSILITLNFFLISVCDYNIPM